MRPATRRNIATGAVLGALALAIAGGTQLAAEDAPPSLELRVVSQDARTITLGWDAVEGADGYRFSSSASTKFSHTWNGTLTRVKFSKGGEPYVVEPLEVTQRGFYPPPTDPEPPPPPQWQVVAAEHASFTLTTARDARFGFDPNYSAIRTLQPGTYVCNAAAFGGDPFPGTPKRCETRTPAGPVPPPPDPPPPPPPGTKPLTNSITSGGTYMGTISGNVTLRTTEPVVIDLCTINGGAIDAYHNIPAPGIDLTIRRCTINGVDAWDSPRWLTARDWKRLVIENNTIVNTRGIELWPNSVSSPITSIVRNRHVNPKGTTNGGSLGAVGNFVQLRRIGQSTPIEIAWNEIVSEYGRSNAEDVFSIYQTAHTRIHDNLVNGQSKPPSFSGSSQNTITIDPNGEPNTLFDNRIERNFLIDAYAAGMFGGNDNSIHSNFIISDGFIGASGVRMPHGYEGIWIAPGYSNNHGHGNLVGYIGAQGRVDGRFTGAPEGDAGEWANNTHFAGTPTRQTELDHVAMWRARAAAAGVVVGAP
jgi:hypothetical protein